MFMLSHFREAAIVSCLLKKVWTTCDQKALFSSVALILAMNDFTIKQLFAERRIFEEHLRMAASKVKVLFWIRFYVLFT